MKIEERFLGVCGNPPNDEAAWREWRADRRWWAGKWTKDKSEADAYNRKVWADYWKTKGK
jgi:hypothetical protein